MTVTRNETLADHSKEDIVSNMGWVCYGYCLMSNHYHLIIETPHANLCKGMRQLNGVYTQASNRRHGRVGHLFQGRYKSIIVDADAYLFINLFLWQGDMEMLGPLVCTSRNAGVSSLVCT